MQLQRLIGIILALSMAACSATSTSPSNPSQRPANCTSLATCCAELPTDQKDHCNAIATNPSSSNADCADEIVQHYVDGYCASEGSAIVTSDGGGNRTSPLDASKPQPDASTCSSLLQMQCFQCCTVAHPACTKAVRVESAKCICTADECQTACADDYCKTPENGATTQTCASCVSSATLGACSPASDGAQQNDPDCMLENACEAECQ